MESVQLYSTCTDVELKPSETKQVKQDETKQVKQEETKQVTKFNPFKKPIDIITPFCYPVELLIFTCVMLVQWFVCSEGSKGS